MALNWDTEQCDPSTPLDDAESEQRHLLIWASMAVDLGRITEKNIDEWFYRLRFLHIIDAHVEPWDKDETLEVLTRWVGLRTNVADKTRAAWKKKILGNIDTMIGQQFASASVKETV